jgi:hypothetical protein
MYCPQCGSELNANNQYCSTCNTSVKTRNDNDMIVTLSEQQKAISVCPKCDHRSLHFNNTYKLYECSNSTCKIVFSQKDMASIVAKKTATTRPVPPKKKSQPEPRAIVGNEYYDTKKKRWKPLSRRIKIRRNDNSINPYALSTWPVWFAIELLLEMLWIILHLLLWWVDWN